MFELISQQSYQDEAIITKEDFLKLRSKVTQLVNSRNKIPIHVI